MKPMSITPQQVTMPLGTVEINGRIWTCYIASTAEQLNSGLGGVESIPYGTGMIFVMSYPRTVRVTTYPMLFNLDIIFLDENFNVIQIERDVEPNNYVDSVPNAKYFIEVNAHETMSLPGETPGYGMSVGDVAILDLGELPEPEPPSQLSLQGIISLVVVGGMFAWVMKSMSNKKKNKQIIGGK